MHSNQKILPKPGDIIIFVCKQHRDVKPLAFNKFFRFFLPIQDTNCREGVTRIIGADNGRLVQIRFFWITSLGYQDVVDTAFRPSQKYRSYIPADIHSQSELLTVVGFRLCQQMASECRPSIWCRRI